MLNSVLRLMVVAIVLSPEVYGQSRPAVPKGGAPVRSSAPAAPQGARRVPATGVSAQEQQPQQPAEPADESKSQIELVPVRTGPRIPAQSPQAKAELDRLLKAWSESSDGIERLEGQIERIVYDTSFETESRSRGEFAYEKPDKGRIDINPVPVTPGVIESRKQEVEQAKQEKRRPEVRLKANGEPFGLTETQAEQWWCDGERIFSLDLARREAMVNQIPVEMQGGNIMDSPLPFLFGMPPERALRRFEIGFHGGSHDPASKKARLVIFPNLPQDSQSWKQADVLLDTQTWLPIAVQLHDPAGTKITVYSFSKLKRNGISFELFQFTPGSRFTPSLKGFHVLPVDAPGGPPPAVVPDLAGLHFQEALKQLEQLGLKRTKDPANRVLLQEGRTAPKPEQKFHVETQTPAPGTPLQPGLKVTLRLYADPARAGAKQ
jgi:hypothetical protein